MIVEEMERRFFELKGKLDVDKITDVEFKTEVQKLRFQDKQGRWWMIGAQSGKWYAYDGMRWVPGQPPADEPAPVVPAAAPMPALSAVTPVPAPISASVPPAPAPSAMTPATPAPLPVSAPPVTPSVPKPETLVTQNLAAQADHAKPALPARMVAPKRAAPAPAFPLRSVLLIGGAAFAALLGVVVLWLLVENFVPGKPISSFFASITGRKPPAVGTPILTLAQPGAPKEVSSFLAQGDQLLVQSNIDSAITQYQTAAQLAPNSAAALTRWSRALAFKGLLSDALDKAKQATQRGANDAEAQAQLCRALAWNGQVNEAIVAGERAVQLDAKNANARANLAEAYLLARRLVEAQAAASAAMQLAPASAEAHRVQAWVLTIQGQREAALGEWRQVTALEPDFYFRHFEYGEVLRLYFNDPASATAEFQRAVTLYGAYVPSIQRLGLALIAANKPLEAVASFQRTITLDPNSVETYAYLGIAFGAANQCSQGIPYFEQTLKLNPNNSVAQRGLADCRAGKPPTLPAAPPLAVPLTPPTIAPK